MTSTTPAVTKALIVDDEPDIRELLAITLTRMGIDTDHAANLAEAIGLLGKQSYQVCLTDLRLPDGDGIELVSWIQAHKPQLPVAVFTAHGNMDTAITAMKAGAFDFISKPVELEHLRRLIKTALQLNTVNKFGNSNSPALLGSADTIGKLLKQIKKVARSQAPIYISGESGTGKELVARAIHYQGGRAEGPFIPVNCGAIPKELMESEFFGHKKGSFTGASADKQGLFQAANGGTLFLDEVADLPLEMQVKLLRALQEKAVRPIGSDREIDVDVRVLSATHKDLGVEVQKERFRNDLYYRINVIQIDIPPLRERKQDIDLLASHFLKQFAEESGLDTPRLSASAAKALQNYNFPGNVRELENILERAFTLCEGDVIEHTDLQLSGAGTQPTAATGASNLSKAEEVESLDEYLEEIEKEVISATLEKTRWNRTAAAKKLGISFRSFRYRLKKLGLDNEDDEP
ncbi:MAG: sigma-54-dependent Fis family transcriptional regulator [Gammaproteobacteria bacterium]|uniref:sigma-54-dependent transcriptional regulator n=1 Tax=Pseudomaricurvus alcaniphilus TaxID=1166482 RepID=UPI00140A6A15|nr:sigma-54 dependent transcriptional regulator [Pseudomaricurvus alcaniphilus]MBR9910457.1 sigma-54-dependent Fis family transcriptional regulator [Gammaproteobacteria bacterium]NHN39304.1 sigma-54-dependent Fis family transcriptional regulator [Pseudomaricurvus alcaniphilus]